MHRRAEATATARGNALSYGAMKQRISDLARRFYANAGDHDELLALGWEITDECREGAQCARARCPEEALRFEALADDVEWLLDSDGRHAPSHGD